MTYTETRNLKITHLIKSTINNFCKLYDASYGEEDDMLII